MNLIGSFVIAFSMYSRIPMPRMDWTEERMRYALCFFPLIGAVIGAAYGFMMGHPGKKLLFMGQDFAQMDEWNENASIEWELLQYPIHSQMKEYVKELNHFYTSHPALYQKDYQTEGFEWINCMDAADNIIAFLRRGADETLLFVCNFA